MKNPKNSLLALTAMILCLIMPLAEAMTVEVHGNQVFATGPVEDDLRKFREAFAKPGVDTVVFVNSPGGDLWTGLNVGRLIADKGLNTVIAGSCISACSIMFMGGKERRFSDAFRPNQTFIGIHGAHDRHTKQINPAAQPQIFAFYKNNMGEKFNTAVMNQALYDMEDAGSLLRVFDPVRSGTTNPYHCRSAQTPREKCSKINNVDALGLGIITHTDLVKINLPTAFAPSNKFLGRDLLVPIADLDSEITEFAEERCPSEGCKKSALVLYKSQATHKAIAVPLEGKGFGFSNGRDTLINAAVVAVYQCNHRVSYPTQLCETRYLNEFDMRQFYTDDEQLHATAFSSLTPPKDQFYGNEEYGGNFTSFKGLKTEKFNDITPQKLPDIQTVGTLALSKALYEKAGWQLIDVGGGLDTIPGSKLLAFGGLAFEDKAKDEAYKQRFMNLLALLAPNKNAPVVFFCAGRSCWQSANAAVRAKQLGYQTVMWYRGGMESWKAAQLPTAPNILRAVAN